VNVALGYLNISAQGKKYVNDCLDSNRLSRGKYTTQFENQFAQFHQVKHAVFLNSGTSALQIALAALKERYGYQDRDEVLVPAITFVATSNIVLQNNMKPVFVDVDPRTFNMDPQLIEKSITPRTRAIIPVHLLGLPCAMDRIMPIARQYGLHVIEDSCETMFAGVNGKSVGSFGDLACFSTYVAHLIVGGVGGLVTTDDAGLAEMCRSLLAHGRDPLYLSIDDYDNTSDNKLKEIMKARYKFDRLGYSYRCTEIEAAIALSELECWEENIARRRHNARLLTSNLQKFDKFLQFPFIPQGLEHSFMMYPLVVKSGVDREALMLFLEKRGIETRYMFPLLNQPVYLKLFSGRASECPGAQHIETHGLLLGIHQGITDSDIQFVADTFAAYFGKCSTPR
jgi:dTDP-4-amino-4,6-dideoxygalactose transaminase